MVSSCQRDRKEARTPNPSQLQTLRPLEPGLLTSPERESPEARRPRVPSGRGRGRLLRTRTLGSASPSSAAPTGTPAPARLSAVRRHRRGGGGARCVQARLEVKAGGPAGGLSAGRAGRRTRAASPTPQLRAGRPGAPWGAGGTRGGRVSAHRAPERRDAGRPGSRGPVCVTGMQSHRGPGRGTARGTGPQPSARGPRASSPRDDSDARL